ncbi:hypothetical protein JCM19294_1663 [Nonlabens tegetincola]|uniref:Uncharacterized protein n=1 Tax=Nonlabens tegetincola TaxID=323273 RepID=A0A090QRF5_9FLAO|nr:T9SS type A sorting domain-containing protein [Nonlabens tegetincola]GAK98041.1 hypothetical protein JCM19294_1663 [Nonlabens tegetincola]
MKKITLRPFIIIYFILFSHHLIAQTAPDEDTNPSIACPSSGIYQNNNTRNVDISNPDNVGTVDDRTCYADYYETNVYNDTWGAYDITHNSNHWDAPNTLQPRIERSLSRSQETGVGSYARFTGTLRILEVGDTGVFGSSGSYFMQTKGKHTGGGGPNDPAICLYLARPVYGPDANGNQVQVSFNIWREQINFRGGSGAAGRTEVFLRNVLKDEIIDIELEVGFRQDPNDPNLKIHYSDAVIGGQVFNWNIPEPERGTESGIRYGVYRVKGGRAQMRWANTTYQKVEVVDTNTPPAADIYRIKNVATGEYMASSGSTIVPSVTGTGSDKEWELIPSGAAGGTYFNIDSQVRGVIRFKGGSTAPELISTNFAPPNTDSDKIWTVIDNPDGTYSFETRNLGRFLYHDTNNTITHSSNIDDRSKWILESTTLSTNDVVKSAVQVYPNPAVDKFTIELSDMSSVNVQIFNMLGRLVYEADTDQSSIEVRDMSRFNTGMYIIKVNTADNNVLHTKLIIK